MLVQRRIEQLLVGRQDYDKREWDDSAQQESANQPPDGCSRKPRPHRSKETHGCQGRLHHSGSTIAGCEFVRSYFDSAFHSGWMFDQIDVDRGSCEQAAGQDGNEFGNLARKSPLADPNNIWSPDQGETDPMLGLSVERNRRDKSST
jgi:hypothetical protein